MIPAGLLRETFIVEQRPTAERNEVGEVVESAEWNYVAELRGMYEATTYIEQEQRGKIAGSISAIVRTRFNKDVTGGMRLRWRSRQDRILSISAVVERGNRDELEITVEEHVQ